MLYDILYALLGFTGDIVVETNHTFHVKDGYSKLTDAEREQINHLVPLGWYYNRFEAFIKRYDMSWGNVSGGIEKLAIYKMAVSAAIQDFQQEYLEDVNELEEILNQEQSLPLSHFIQHMQKVVLWYLGLGHVTL